MPIKLHNNLKKQKEILTPLNPKNVGIYVCGPTVYDRAHLGNARAVVVFDLLFRLLRHSYGEKGVTYVRNITDLDDKINARAAQSGRSISEITTQTIAWFHDDMGALGALRPTHEPRATHYIAQMQSMIAQLIEKNHAYVAQGHVLFAVDSYEMYGALSRRSLDDMMAGARVEVAPYKKNPMDFVLWKPSEGQEPGWDSPWGYGRPGWHIECSAMARDLLGERFDIHGGGLDLQFPHHENEIAQSRACCGPDSFAQIWLHNEMLQVEGKKMSKSLGNFFTVRELLDQGWPGEVIRMLILSTHYAKPMDWTADKARVAMATLRKWRAKCAAVNPADAVDPAVLAALCDDLNSPGAIAALHKIEDPATLKASAQLLGLLEEALGGWDHVDADDDVADLINALLEARNEARKARDFARADQLRDGFAFAGVIVKDTPDGTDWELSADFDRSKLEGLK